MASMNQACEEVISVSKSLANRHVVPGIEHRLVAPEAVAVIANHPADLAQLDAIGIGADLHRSPDRAGRHLVFVPVELNQTGL